MQKFRSIALLLVSALVLSACSLFQKSTGPSYPSTYSEDLSYLRQGLFQETEVAISEESSSTPRPVFVQPQQDVNRRIDMILDTLKTRNAERGFLEGFSVQVISTRSRTEATEIRNQIVKDFEELRPEISYDQPNYKVKIGFFNDRLQAYEVYSQLPKQDFPYLVIVPERRPIR
jgi:hypothetical protein